jgi:hypothetical protein
MRIAFGTVRGLETMTSNRKSATGLNQLPARSSTLKARWRPRCARRPRGLPSSSRGDDFDLAPLLGERDADAAAAGAQIEHATLSALRNAIPARIHQQLGLRPRNQNVAAHSKARP